MEDYNVVEVISYNPENNNGFLKRLASDLGINNVEGLQAFLYTSFPEYYDPNGSIVYNVKKINNALRLKEKSGEKLTDIEKMVLSVTNFAVKEVEKTKSEEIKNVMREKLPLIGLVAVGLFLVFRR